MGSWSIIFTSLNVQWSNWSSRVVSESHFFSSLSLFHSQSQDVLTQSDHTSLHQCNPFWLIICSATVRLCNFIFFFSDVLHVKNEAVLAAVAGGSYWLIYNVGSCFEKRLKKAAYLIFCQEYKGDLWSVTRKPPPWRSISPSSNNCKGQLNHQDLLVSMWEKNWNIHKETRKIRLSLLRNEQTNLIFLPHAVVFFPGDTGMTSEWSAIGVSSFFFFLSSIAFGVWLGYVFTAVKFSL